MKTITIPLDAFRSALKELRRIEELADEKANVGYSGKYTVQDSFGLTIACMSCAAIQDLIGYLSEEEREKLEKAML